MPKATTATNYNVEMSDTDTGGYEGGGTREERGTSGMVIGCAVPHYGGRRPWRTHDASGGRAPDGFFHGPIISTDNHGSLARCPPVELSPSNTDVPN